MIRVLPRRSGVFISLTICVLLWPLLVTGQLSSVDSDGITQPTDGPVPTTSTTYRPDTLSKLPTTLPVQISGSDAQDDSGWQRWLPGVLGLPSAPGDAGSISQFVKTTELLGPLTPIAMSPFFGITVLSGLTQIPENWPFADWLSNNHLLGNNPVLRHPITFWLFLVLTAVTSIPRFTKVTKPIAQSLDWVESYAGLITSLLIMALGLWIVSPEQTTQQAVVEAGIVAWAFNAVLLVAAAVNFLVVKSVRFLFEMLIWISPIPFVDACFEVLNKFLCLGLLLFYAFSPTLALLVNLVIFLACVVILRWAQRRVNYHVHLWLEPIIQWWFPSYHQFDGHNLWVYCEQDFPPFRKYDRLHVYKWEDEWYLMRYDLFWKKKFRTFTHDDLPMLEADGTRCVLILQQQVPIRFVFHRGYAKVLNQIAENLGISTRERVEFRNQRKIQEAEQPQPRPGESNA